MTTFLKAGSNKYELYSDNQLELANRLPALNYNFMFNPMQGPYLEVIAPFSDVPYADEIMNKRYDRIMTTFHDRPGKTTGVLLSGTKGSGKTSLMRLIGHRADIPVINVKFNYDFNTIGSVLSKMEQPYILLIDEFEKKYPMSSDSDGDEDSEISSPSALLSFLDGIDSCQKLVVITANDTFKVSEYLLNRTGRILYHFKYAGMTEEEALAFLMKTNLGSDKIDELMTLLAPLIDLDQITYDTLQCVIDECIRYPSMPSKELISALNIGSMGFSSTRYEIQILVNGELTMPFGRTEYMYEDIINESFSYNINESFLVPSTNEYGHVRGFIDQSMLMYKDKQGFVYSLKTYANRPQRQSRDDRRLNELCDIRRKDDDDVEDSPIDMTNVATIRLAPIRANRNFNLF